MFKIYYEDDTTFDSSLVRLISNNDQLEEVEAITTEHTFTDMPDSQGVVAILQAEQPGDEFELLQDQKYYYWNDKKWIGGDLWNVLAFFEEKKDLIQYQVDKIKVKQHGRWQKTSELGLYAYLADTGLVLMGTGFKGIELHDLLKKVTRDAREQPVHVRLPKGARIRSRRERNAKSRNVRPLR